MDAVDCLREFHEAMYQWGLAAIAWSKMRGNEKQDDDWPDFEALENMFADQEGQGIPFMIKFEEVDEDIDDGVDWDAYYKRRTQLSAALKAIFAKYVYDGLNAVAVKGEGFCFQTNEPKFNWAVMTVVSTRNTKTGQTIILHDSRKTIMPVLKYRMINQDGQWKLHQDFQYLHKIGDDSKDWLRSKILP